MRCASQRGQLSLNVQQEARGASKGRCIEFRMQVEVIKRDSGIARLERGLFDVPCDIPAPGRGACTCFFPATVISLRPQRSNPRERDASPPQKCRAHHTVLTVVRDRPQRPAVADARPKGRVASRSDDMRSPRGNDRCRISA